MRVISKISLALMGLMLCAPVGGAAESPKYQELNLALAQSHIIPRYQKLEESMSHLSESAQTHCQSPNEKHLGEFQKSYHQAMDAWMAIQHIRFGPILEDSRSYKIQFWPDDHGIINKHLKKFLKKMDGEANPKQKLLSGSVAIQGLPALEQLLFSRTKPLLSEQKQFSKRCQIAGWIALHLKSVSHSIVEEWESDTLQILTTASKGNRTYLSDEEASQDFLMSLQAGFQFIGDSKLSFPLGKTEKKARPKKAESWRSERSLQNIVINLKALSSMYRGEEGMGFDDLVKKHDPAFNEKFIQKLNTTLQSFEAIPLSLAKAVMDDEQRAKLIQLREEVNELRQMIEKRVTETTGIRMGFNGLDGD